MGEVFAGRYELVDPIGRGGVGAVWRAWDQRRRRYVAAKVLQQSDAHSLLRFVREQALRIDHPHVLAPASWAADDDKVLFTMDLVAGGSLVHLVGDYGPLPPTFVCTLLDQLLSGLAAVHAEGVVHRDVKPANVLLEATGAARPRLRLSDFGIAMRLGEPRLTQTDLVVGTPGYLAPEQIVGAEPGFPADLFAAGLVALYLLEGAKPDAKALVRYFTEHGTPSAPQNIPEPLWQVVATLIQPDPDARFRTATGARKALAAAAELLPDPGPDDEIIEIFDQIGPLPPGFTADGPARRITPPSAPHTAATPGTPAAPGTPAVPPGSPSLPPGAPSLPGAAAAPGTPAPPGAPPAPGAAAAPGSAAAQGAAPAPGTGDHASQALPNAAAPGHLLNSSDGAAPPPPYQPPAPPAPSPQSGAAPDAPPPYAPGPGLPDNTPNHTPNPRTLTPPPAGPTLAPQPHAHPLPSMSDTGSFPLPPPQSTATTAATPRPPTTPEPPPSPQPYAAPAPPSAPRPYPHPPHPHPSPDTSTTAYTAQAPQSHPPQPAAPQAPLPTPPPAVRGHRARRAGPPAKVTVPLLLLALACYTVGFWALTRI